MNALKLIALLIAFPLLLAATGAWELQRIDMDAMGVAHGLNRVQLFLAPGVVFFGLLSALIGAGALAWIHRAGKRAQQSQVMLISTFLEGRQLLPGWLVGHIVTVSVAVVLVLAYECLALWKQGSLSSFEVKLALLALLGEAFCVYGVWLLLKRCRGLLKMFEPTPRQMFGQLVRPDQAPQLWRQVEAWAGQMGALPPEHIVVSLSPGFHITACETWLYPEGLALQGRTLHLPLCYLALLSREEVGAIVGHELAHFVGDKAEYSQRFLPLFDGARRNLENLAANLQECSPLEARLLKPVALFGNHFLAQMHNAALALGHNRHYEADAAAASLAGNTTLASALLRMAVLGPQVKTLLETYLDLNKHNWPAVEDIAWQAITELQHRELKLSNHDLINPLLHPTHRLPATGERLKALGVPVQDVLASATRSTSTPVANAALDAWFSDALPLCRQLSVERVTAAVNQDTQYTEELETLASAVEGEGEFTLHEGARLRGIVIVAIALPCAALLLFLLMLNGLAPGRFSEDKVLAFWVAAGLACLGLVWGARLIKRSPLTALRITPDHLFYNNLAQPLPIRDIAKVEVVDSAGLYVFVHLEPDAPWPAARATGFGVPGVWRQKWHRVLTLRAEYLCIDGERVHSSDVLNLLVDYINASRAREQLQQQAPRVPEAATQRDFSV